MKKKKNIFPSETSKNGIKLVLLLPECKKGGMVVNIGLLSSHIFHLTKYHGQQKEFFPKNHKIAQQLAGPKLKKSQNIQQLARLNLTKLGIFSAFFGLFKTIFGNVHQQKSQNCLVVGQTQVKKNSKNDYQLA